MTSGNAGRAWQHVALGVLLVGAAGCSTPPTERTGTAKAAVIYDADTRLEPFAAGAAWSDAVGRAVALIPVTEEPALQEPEASVRPDAGTREVWSDGGAPAPFDAGVSKHGPPTLRERFDVCPEERFAEQLSLADCSGVLIAPDTVLTAGHCFLPGEGCDRYRYGFDFAQRETGPAPQPTELACAELVIREVGQLADGSDIDYAFVRLEQPWPDAPDGPQLRRAALEPGALLTSVGFPLGLPVKVDPQGEVVSVGRTQLEVWSDTYHGSSGGALYDAQGRLAAISTEGEADLELDVSGQCYRSRGLDPTDTDAAERAMLASVAVDRACQRAADLAICADSVSASQELTPSVSTTRTTRTTVSSQRNSSSARGGNEPSSGSETRTDAGLPNTPTNTPTAEDERSRGCSIGPAQSARSSFWLVLLYVGALLLRVFSRRCTVAWFGFLD